MSPLEGLLLIEGYRNLVIFSSCSMSETGNSTPDRRSRNRQSTNLNNESNNPCLKVEISHEIVGCID